MPDDTAIARAIAFFNACDDGVFLVETLRAIRPRAAAAVRNAERRGGETPPPADIAAALAPATRDEALRTVRTTDDFARLQALTRAIGRRVEELQSRQPPE